MQRIDHSKIVHIATLNTFYLVYNVLCLQFSIVECVFVALMDQFPSVLRSTPNRPVIFRAVTITVYILISLPMVCEVKLQFINFLSCCISEKLNLILYIRKSPSVASFRKNLKTNLFNSTFSNLYPFLQSNPQLWNIDPDGPLTIRFVNLVH